MLLMRRNKTIFITEIGVSSEWESMTRFPPHIAQILRWLSVMKDRIFSFRDIGKVLFKYPVWTIG